MLKSLLRVLCPLVLLLPCNLLAQSDKALVGDYSGTLGPLRLILHMKDSGGQLGCTLDSPNQGAFGLACANVHRESTNLRFDVPAVHGAWSGSIGQDGKLLRGTWTQGQAMPLDLARVDASATDSGHAPVDGFWLGTLRAGSIALRVQITVRTDGAGRTSCLFDSIDQFAAGLACDDVSWQPRHFRFSVPLVHGSWVGTLTPDGNALDGTWTQGQALPLRFVREAAPVPVAHATAAATPTPLAELDRVLRQDMADAHVFDSGILSAGTGIGVALGVLDRGDRRVLLYGAARRDSLFQIGSITKTFTGLLLAQRVAEGKVHLDDPVRALLPAGTVAAPAGQQITLLDLATQHSGLPRLPDNLHPADPADPYADYGTGKLFAYIAQHGVARPERTEFLYSNLGFALLGQALASQAGESYSALLGSEVLAPLGMKETAIELSPAQQGRLLPAHASRSAAAKPWRLNAFAPAGGLRSTVDDMLLYLDAQLHPEAHRSSTEEAGTTLPAAIAASHVPHGEAPGASIALAWLTHPEQDIYWHDGATGGYNAAAIFSPRQHRGLVVLINDAADDPGASAELFAQHVWQRLDGKPAVPIAP